MTTKSSPTTYRLDNYYDIYIKSGLTRKRKLTREEFKAVMKSFLSNTLDALIEGKTLKMGYHLGSLKLVRYERHTSKPVVNWNESLKYKAQLIAEGKPLYNKETGEGYEYIVYFTEGYFYGLRWEKEYIPGFHNYSLHNIMFYKLKSYKRAKMKIASSIDEMSLITYDFKKSIFT